jgi:hypothetical protein
VYHNPTHSTDSPRLRYILDSSSPTGIAPHVHEYQATSPGRVKQLETRDRGGADWPKASMPFASLSLCVELLVHAWYPGMRHGKRM